MTAATLKHPVSCIQPQSFEAEKHWYPKALNATIHPMMSFFLNLSIDRIIKRYCHLQPRVKYAVLDELLSYVPKYFQWAGADLIHVTNEKGARHMAVIENNSCPSGQKSMPLLNDAQEQGGYRKLIEETFLPWLKGKRRVVKGALAVIYDKNPMEAEAYAGVMADVFNEPVYYAYYTDDQASETIRFEKNVMQLLVEGEWIPIRAAFRYVTQRPWMRLPLQGKTHIFNPIITCLAGGRNKMIAAKAYDLFNAELQESGLSIFTPQTIWDVSKAEIPLWVGKMGGQAVIKNPYSNAGQGVYTIVSQKELDEFMAIDFKYEQFIVQSLIGNYQWSSISPQGRLYHVGTMPNKKGESFVCDIRMMVGATPSGIQPICVYSRRSKMPLVDEIEDSTNSWDMLGTNLSIKLGDNQWNSDTNRLLLTDRRDFNTLGVGLDDLIEAYIQTVLSMIAIDRMGKMLVGTKGQFKMSLFKSLNRDATLINEIMK